MKLDSASVTTLTDTTDADADAEADADADLEVQSEDIRDCEDDDPRFEVSDNGGGVIEVRHEGYTINCCADLVIGAELTTQIDITYTDIEKECDCTCGFELRYEVANVPAGTWVVDAMGTSETVTVE